MHSLINTCGINCRVYPIKANDNPHVDSFFHPFSVLHFRRNRILFSFPPFSPSSLSFPLSWLSYWLFSLTINEKWGMTAGEKKKFLSAKSVDHFVNHLHSTLHKQICRRKRKKVEKGNESDKACYVAIFRCIRALHGNCTCSFDLNRPRQPAAHTFDAQNFTQMLA